VTVRGRDVAGVIEQYTKFVKPSFDTYVAPSRKHADVIIPWARCDAFVWAPTLRELCWFCVRGSQEHNGPGSQVRPRCCTSE
jgi:Phosphoribulokinase / Uridine kinase family